jgi:hypothetical protein
MADLHPEISGATIVLLGSFNPSIFQPQWFVRQNLLPEKEAEAAETKVIVPQITHFETERFVVQVVQERFVASSKPNTNSGPLRDLVQGTFFVLEHTPLRALGLNFAKHFPMGSEENWHRIGDKLAPKEGWNEVLDGRPGLRSLTILTNKTEPKGALFTVKVEPSLQVKYGVYFETNEHYPAPETEPLKGLMDILAVRWEEAEAYASRVANHILTWSETDRQR